MKRRGMSRQGSRRYFSATAGNQKVHPKNAPRFVMRGGIRL